MVRLTNCCADNVHVWIDCHCSVYLWYDQQFQDVTLAGKGFADSCDSFSMCTAFHGRTVDSYNLESRLKQKECRILTLVTSSARYCCIVHQLDIATEEKERFLMVLLNFVTVLSFFSVTFHDKHGIIQYSEHSIAELDIKAICRRTF